MHKFNMSFVFHFYILRLTSWIWTNPLTEGLKFERTVPNQTHTRTSILNTAYTHTSGQFQLVHGCEGGKGKGKEDNEAIELHGEVFHHARSTASLIERGHMPCFYVPLYLATTGPPDAASLGVGSTRRYPLQQKPSFLKHRKHRHYELRVLRYVFTFHVLPTRSTW